MLARMAAAWARTSHDHGLLAIAGAAGAGKDGVAHEPARIHPAMPCRRKSVKPTPLARGELSASSRNCS
jgi:hypothetical protein